MTDHATPPPPPAPTPAPATPAPPLPATPLGPVDASQRLGHLDVLRGVALLGIFLMNIELFGRAFMSMSMAVPGDLEGLDRIAGLAIYALVQGKFWTMFSLLFGVGFALMLERADRASRPFGAVYVRRTLALIGFGLVHAIFLWPGDILFSYGLSALVLLAFMRANTGVMLGLGIPLYVGPVLMVLLSGVAMGAWQYFDAEAFAEYAGGAELEFDLPGLVAQADAVYPAGGFMEVTAQRLTDLGQLWSPMQMVMFMLPSVLGMFLVGAALLRTGRIREPGQHLRFWRRMLWIALPVGLLLTALSLWVGASFPLALMDPGYMLATGIMMLGNPLVMLGYVAILLLALQQPAWQRRLAVFAPAGRMALTNYLTQSLVCSVVFYGYGLGLYGQVPRAWQVVLVAGVFALQVGFSAWWLQRFRYGPMEWLWRSLTYMKLQPMRR